MKQRSILLLFALLLVAIPAGSEEGNPAMILFNITPAAFDDCHVFVSPLDEYGRAGTAFAILSRASIDAEMREDISMFSPAGWQPGGIYQRCHLVGAQLTKGTACLENLITGTEYLNIEGMLPIENRVRSYIERTGEHCLYKVTPIYQGTELLPRAVEITIYSIESIGLRMSAYCYNIQPGTEIDYASGSYSDSEGDLILLLDGDAAPGTRQGQPDYVLNKKSRKFHYPWCNGVASMSDKNRQDFYGTRDEAIAMGYEPCGSCNP